MDPRIRIRIHPKMSWIRNTAVYIDDLDLEVLRRMLRVGMVKIHRQHKVGKDYRE
jgi:hypothetical protein